MLGKEKKSQSHHYGIDAHATPAKAFHGGMFVVQRRDELTSGDVRKSRVSIGVYRSTASSR
jgi:hypothetical protein